MSFQLVLCHFTRPLILTLRGFLIGKSRFGVPCKTWEVFDFMFYWEIQNPDSLLSIFCVLNYFWFNFFQTSLIFILQYFVFVIVILTKRNKNQLLWKNINQDIFITLERIRISRALYANEFLNMLIRENNSESRAMK